jgi:TonB family protein
MNGKKILIIDFDEKSVDPLSSYLDEAGYQVSVAKDGEEGLEKCKAEHPDLVILEPMLPKLHGFELCSIITKDMEPKIPVIILTKFYKEQQFKIESTRSFGASAFLSKPFVRKELEGHLTELLSGSADMDEDDAAETEIPNSFSAESLQNLEENLENEEVEVEKHEEQEREILDLTTPVKTQEATPTNSGNISQEIDDMLKDTISDFGLRKSEEKPAPKVETPEIIEPEPVPEDKVSSVLEDLKTEVNIEEKIAPVVEEPTPFKVEEKESPAEPETTPKLEDGLMQELEPNIAASKSEPTPKKEEFVAEERIELKEELPVEKAGEKTGAPEKASKEEIEPPKEEIKEEIKAEIAELKEEVKTETVETREEVKAEQEEKAESPDEKAELESFFDDYGALEESPTFFQNLLSKIKSTPPKLLIPTVAAPVIVIIVAVIVLQPKSGDKTPVQQASLGVPTIQKTAVEPAANEATDPMATEDEGLSASDDAAAQKETEDPAQTPPEEVEKPVEKPQPKRKSSPPPFQPLTAEEGGEAAIDPKVVGDIAAPMTEGAASEDTPPVETANEETDPPAEEGTQGTRPTTPPANQTQTGDLVAIQQVDEPPIVLKRVLPEYPAAARNMRITGTILISALIDERGNVVQTAVIRGVKGPFGFNEASEAAVKQWRFKPATKDGVKVKVWKQIPISFQKEN